MNYHGYRKRPYYSPMRERSFLHSSYRAFGPDVLPILQNLGYLWMI